MTEPKICFHIGDHRPGLRTSYRRLALVSHRRHVDRLEAEVLQERDIAVHVLEGAGHGMFDSEARRLRLDFVEILSEWVQEKVR